MAILISLILATTFLIVGGRRLDTAIKVIILQAILLASLTFLLAWRTKNNEIYIAAILTILIKALLIPFILNKVVNRVNMARKIKSYLNMKMSFVVCAGLVIIAYAVTNNIAVTNSEIGKSALPAAISMVLIGLFVMISRKLAIMQIIGLLIMENGLFLVGVATTNGMPLVVELGIFLDILVGVLIMGILAFRINQTFDTINTEDLNNLRG